MKAVLDWFSSFPPWVGLVSLGVGLAVMVWSLQRVRQAEHRAAVSRREAEEAAHIKNDFVAMVSHELRTPLTSIAGFADTLVTSWSSLKNSEIEEFLGYISKQSQYLGDLVEDVLVIPRLEAGRLRFRPEVFDLGVLVQDLAGMMFPTGGGREAMVSLPVGVRMHADSNRVQQVVRNLLENARKYGGDQVLIEGLAHGEQYVLVISDNGPGVPDDAAGTIFEHFEQLSKGDSRSSSGIGLGLPIARRLARAMGGEVWYERRFPTGSRFCFSLPVKAVEEEPVAHSPQSTVPIQSRVPSPESRVEPASATDRL